MPYDEDDVWVPDEDYSDSYDPDPIDDGYWPDGDRIIDNDALEADVSDS